MSHKSKRSIWISAALIGALAVLVIGVGIHRVTAANQQEQNSAVSASVEKSEISELKTCNRDISKQCCKKDKPKACPDDSNNPGCNKEEPGKECCQEDKLKACPEDGDNPGCNKDGSEKECCPKDKPKACPDDCDKPCCSKEEPKTCSQDSTKSCSAK